MGTAQGMCVSIAIYTHLEHPRPVFSDSHVYLGAFQLILRCFWIVHMLLQISTSFIADRMCMIRECKFKLACTCLPHVSTHASCNDAARPSKRKLSRART